MEKLFRLCLIVSSILLISFYNRVNGLTCYSCSSLTGDRFCHEDSFDPAKVSKIECPPDADVCVRAIQRNNGQTSAGAIFRTCGSSDKSKNKEILMLGYYPPYNKCIVQKIDEQSPEFKDSLFEICGVAQDLGNVKGEYKFPKTD